MSFSYFFVTLILKETKQLTYKQNTYKTSIVTQIAASLRVKIRQSELCTLTNLEKENL